VIDTRSDQYARAESKPLDEHLRDFHAGMIAKGTTSKQTNLAEGGIPYVDDAGRYADFHAPRHTTGSLQPPAPISVRRIHSAQNARSVNVRHYLSLSTSDKATVMSKVKTIVNAREKRVWHYVSTYVIT